MIVLRNPRAAKPRNQWFPLSNPSLAAVLEGREAYVAVDGNRHARQVPALLDLLSRNRVEILASTVVPGLRLAPANEEFRQVNL